MHKGNRLNQVKAPKQKPCPHALLFGFLPTNIPIYQLTLQNKVTNMPPIMHTMGAYRIYDLNPGDELVKFEFRHP